MNMRNYIYSIFILLLTFVFLGQGCTSKPNYKEIPDGPTPDFPFAIIEPEVGGDDLTVVEYGGDHPAPARIIPPVYDDFSLIRYKAALANHEPIYLFFYADWCPTCLAQEPVNQQVILSHPTYVRAFKIHILDDAVSPDEKALAEYFNVTRQHTSILINKNGEEVSRTIGTRSETQLSEDLTQIAPPYDAI